MRLEFHRQIVAGPKLADEFYEELRSFFRKAADSPEAYDIRERDLRRVNRERFPYHFLFRVVGDRVRFWLFVMTSGDQHWSRSPLKIDCDNFNPLRFE